MQMALAAWEAAEKSRVAELELLVECPSAAIFAGTTGKCCRDRWGET
jgi:hypothetical protein